jgi:NAD(P)H-hydrate epimerase
MGRLRGSSLKKIQLLAKGKGCLVIGPGLGVTPETRKIVTGLIKSSAQPLLLDADALNVLEKEKSKLSLLKRSRFPVILTPHPGEMGRLVNQPVSKIQQDRIGHATSLAQRARCLVVLKGFRTIVATPEGSYFVNPTGNPGMATAGMGDLLTGMMGALVGSGDPDSILEAVLAAVYIHGLAGDRLKKRLGDRGLLASDLIHEIPLAFKELVGK